MKDMKKRLIAPPTLPLQFSLLLLLLSLMPPILSGADNTGGIFSDPEIGDGEETTYRIVEIKDKQEREESLTLQIAWETEGNTAVYSATSRGRDRDVKLLLRRRDLQPLVRESEDRSHGSSIRSRELVEEVRPLGKNELFVLNMEDLVLQLRAYPFTDPRPVRVVLPGQDPEDDGMAMLIDLVKKESIDAGGREIRTYRLELSVKMKGPLAFFSGLIPKTSFWYAQEKPHYLVRYEGASGFGGNGERTMEMTSYRKGE